jgi:hypothetical protein
MTKPAELLDRINDAFDYQMKIRERLSKAKLKIDRDIIARELNESCEFLQKLDSQLASLIEAERKKFAIIYRSNAA